MRTNTRSWWVGIGLGLLSAVQGAWGVWGGDDPYADEVVSYTAGTGVGAYSNALVALGRPERVSGELFEFPGVVSPFAPAFAPDELVSVGSGGELVVKFNTPVTDDPNNPYGVDLLIFGNAQYNDAKWPSAIVDSAFTEGGVIEVSPDGVAWTLVPDVSSDSLFPTLGFLDSGPYDFEPGTVESDFTRPVDPSLTLTEVMGMTFEELRERYHGSGGGTGIDLADVGLSAITHVRITHTGGARTVPEIDGFVDVSPRRPGDVDYDGLVGIADLLAVIGAWGLTTPGGVPADFNTDGLIGIADLLLVIGNWG